MVDFLMWMGNDVISKQVANGAKQSSVPTPDVIACLVIRREARVIFVRLNMRIEGRVHFKTGGVSA